MFIRTNFQCYVQVKTADLELTLVRGSASCPGVKVTGSGGAEGDPAPLCRFVNVELCGTIPQCGATGSQGTVLLENPLGDFPLSLPALIHQVGFNDDTGVTTIQYNGDIQC